MTTGDGTDLTRTRILITRILMMMPSFVLMVVRAMPPHFESAGSESNREQPPSDDKNSDY
jgi:hypothetical protein